MNFALQFSHSLLLIEGELKRDELFFTILYKEKRLVLIFYNR